MPNDRKQLKDNTETTAPPEDTLGYQKVEQTTVYPEKGQMIRVITSKNWSKNHVPKH